MQLKPFDFPEDFKLGAATASLQIEGGDTNNSWYRWAHEPGRIADGTTADVADDHWNRVDEDIALMKKLNLHCYRMGLEWSRIEPEQGQFDQEAIDHYRKEILALKEAGIEPMVTLHHFSNPLWLEDGITWLDEKVIECFGKYTESVVENLGDLVSEWVTINEPNVYLTFGFVHGIWPPGSKSIGSYFKGAKNMIGAHIRAYRTIHRIRQTKGFDKSDTRVGVAHHLRVFTPKSGRKRDKLVCSTFDRLFHDIFTVGMGTGELLMPLGYDYPWGKGDFQDFFGVNYYTRDIVEFTPTAPADMFSIRSLKEGCETNDLGWEIYPFGLYELCSRYYHKFKKPIYITENGTCDNKDTFRAQYIYDHLREVRRLLDHNVDVRKYYHWSLMDNFEWAEGLEARFGLIDVNYENQKRTFRKSGEFYADICNNQGITQEALSRFF